MRKSIQTKYYTKTCAGLSYGPTRRILLLHKLRDTYREWTHWAAVQGYNGLHWYMVDLPYKMKNWGKEL